MKRLKQEIKRPQQDMELDYQPLTGYYITTIPFSSMNATRKKCFEALQFLEDLFLPRRNIILCYSKPEMKNRKEANTPNPPLRCFSGTLLYQLRLTLAKQANNSTAVIRFLLLSHNTRLTYSQPVNTTAEVSHFVCLQITLRPRVATLFTFKTIRCV